MASFTIARASSLVSPSVTPAARGWSQRIPLPVRVVENDEAMGQFVNRSQVVETSLVAATHILCGYIVTTLQNSFANVFECKLRTAKSYIDDADTPTSTPRLLDEREMTASGDGGFDGEASALAEQVIPASHGKATSTKRCSFG
jgi:hypothetical protein